MAQIKYLDSRRIMGASGDTVEATTFEDDFSSDNWTDYGSDFGVSGGTMAWNKTVNSGSWINLGSSLSDEKWVCRFTLNILNASSFNNEQPIFMIGSVSGSVTDATTMDYIGFQLQTYSNDYYIWCGNGATLASPTFNTNLSKTITTGTVYVELRRTSATEVILSIYSDSGFSSLSATKTLTISSGITGLQYFRLHSRLAGTGTINGTIDNLEIYNGLSSVTSKPKPALSLSGCKAYYNFEQTSGSLTNIATTANGFDDGLGSSADGTSSGGVTQNATGKVGSYAWDFDGSDDYVNVSGITLPAYNSTDTFSISAWINMDTLATSPTQYQRLFHWYDGTKQWQLYIFSSGEIGFNNTQANQGVDTSSSVISTGTWYHLVVVKTGNNTYKIYLNGVDQSTTSSGGGNPSPSIQTFRIGASITGSGSDGHFNGRIDEFSVFTRALTSSEISTLYNDGTGVAVNDSSITAKPETNSIFVETDTASRYWFNGTTWYRAVDDTGLKAYWKFNESSGSIINVSESADSLGTTADIAVTGATHGATGQIGDALSYDGSNDYGTAGTSLSQYQFMYSADAQYTLCMWFKLLSKIDSQGISSLFGNFGTANANGVVLQLNDGTTTDKVKLLILGESTNTRYIDSSIDDFMDDDTNWHFLCVRFDGTAAGHAAGNNYEVSIDNGAFQTLSTSSAPSGTANSDESFKFGVYPATGIGRYLGFLQDETSLWSRKLTDDEVSELYNGGSGREIY